MRQNRLFVPMRIALTALAMLFVAIVSPKAAPEIILTASPVEKPIIDPIVTGETIPAGLADYWKAKKANFEECGLCGEEQAYPGGLED